MPFSHAFLRSPWFRHLLFPVGCNLLLAAVFYVVIYQAPPSSLGEPQSSPLDPLFLYGGLLIPALVGMALSVPLRRAHRALGGWTAFALVLSMGIGAWYQKWYSAIPLEPWFYKSMGEDVPFWTVYSLYGFVFVLGGLSLGALYEVADARPDVLEEALSPLLGTSERLPDKYEPTADGRDSLSKSARRKKKRKKRLDERKTEMSNLLTEVLADGSTAGGASNPNAAEDDGEGDDDGEDTDEDDGEAGESTGDPTPRAATAGAGHATEGRGKV